MNKYDNNFNCTEENCILGETELLDIVLKSSSQIQLTASDVRMGFPIEVKGDCHDGDFPTNRIEWTIAYSDAPNEPFIFSDFAPQEVCTDNHFRFSIQIMPDELDENFNYEIVLTMVGIDSNHKLHSNFTSGQTIINLLGKSQEE